MRLKSAHPYPIYAVERISDPGDSRLRTEHGRQTCYQSLLARARRRRRVGKGFGTLNDTRALARAVVTVFLALRGAYFTLRSGPYPDRRIALTQAFRLPQFLGAEQDDQSDRQRLYI